MPKRYLPPSDFLNAIIKDEVSFDDPAFGSDNLTRLIAMTRDAHVANRDWATLLLAQLECDRPEVRDALLSSADDVDSNVRAEAIYGLALTDTALALPFLQRELAAKAVSMPLLEAAANVAHPSLVPDLQDFAAPSDDPYLDKLVQDAISACSAQS
ncbi:HEAT repeat domain-containing protein [Novosphingobium beihaiensis]|uniref:Lyase n=1 Tax=Novosphingobium beihaiensis TaxID=2930389 RepID=A0ABT0BPG6_9SPHN|nr:HEAT repeat domain-containing protein [Novosphingobium beihaiensis]MCJ2186943.1 lyase [Novosphingobium beihaiensis]